MGKHKVNSNGWARMRWDRMFIPPCFSIMQVSVVVEFRATTLLLTLAVQKISVSDTELKKQRLRNLDDHGLPSSFVFALFRYNPPSTSCGQD